MLYFSLIDILFLLVGVLIGVAIMSIMAASGQRAHCEDCLIKEIVKYERKEKI